jgi:cell wall assembly regulator SMI1
MNPNSIKPLWKRVESWLAKRMPAEWLKSPGLTEAQICAAEEVLGHRLPDDVRESYKIRNGLRIDIYGFGYLLPLVRPKKQLGTKFGNRNVVEEWRDYKKAIESLNWQTVPVKPKGPIADIYWTRDWIPLFDDLQGNMHWLDMNPPKRGVIGQIIDWDKLFGPTRICARSFRGWLNRLADEIEQDRYQLEVSDFSALLVRRSKWKRLQVQDALAMQAAAENTMPPPEPIKWTKEDADFFKKMAREVKRREKSKS